MFYGVVDLRKIGVTREIGVKSIHPSVVHRNVTRRLPGTGNTTQNCAACPWEQTRDVPMHHRRVDRFDANFTRYANLTPVQRAPVPTRMLSDAGPVRNGVAPLSGPAVRRLTREFGCHKCHWPGVRARLVQSVERLTLHLTVGGSSPASASFPAGACGT